MLARDVRPIKYFWAFYNIYMKFCQLLFSAILKNIYNSICKFELPIYTVSRSTSSRDVRPDLTKTGTCDGGSEPASPPILHGSKYSDGEWEGLQDYDNTITINEC